ncbi:MAG: hypothetical protein JWM80_6304 [Cyanobacteria bacterium RYN_339]|nr:hypothetical protein [Cyanobacteria bacterium RYN_339]
MSRSTLFSLALTAVVAVASCTGSGGSTVTVKPTTRPVVQATHSPSPVAAPSAGLSPEPSASPSRAVTEVGPSPPIFRPSEAPTPLASGHATPLPRDQFPPDPSPTTTTAVVSTPTPVPTPVVTPTPGAPAEMVVVSNTLEVGSGSVGGVVFGPPSTEGGSPVLVCCGTINIVDKVDQSKRAVLTVGTDGQYRLGALALKTYLVWITRSGYTADTAPTEVTLSIGPNQNSNTPLVLVKTVPLPTQ